MARIILMVLRLGSILVDLVVGFFFLTSLIFIVGILTVIIPGLEAIVRDDISPLARGTIFLTFWFITYIIFIIIMLHKGQTIGKKIFGLRVKSRDGSPLQYRKVTLGLILSIPSFLFFGLGFLSGFLDANGRTIYDKIAGTMVVRVADRKGFR